MVRHISLVIALLAGLLAGGAALAEDRPNIVLIMADDLGWESVGAYGGQSYATPNIDALAARGLTFERAYATPLCTNTRLQLMTGKYQQRYWEAFGTFPRSERTFGHYMRAAGYATAMVGKWQLTSYDGRDYPGAEARRDIGMHPRDAGFDEWALFHTGHTEDKGSRYADPTIETHEGFLGDTKGQYGPDISVARLVDFIDRKGRAGQPFFAYYAMALPHGPFNPTPDSPEWADPATRMDTDERHYGPMVEYMDKLVGRILSALEERRLSEDTLVLFYSDNGTHPTILSQADGRWLQGGKSYTNELGIRVPLVAYWKGRTPAGGTTQALVDSTDFLPTMLAAARRPDLLGEPIDGISFLPLLLGEEGPQREWSYLHFETRPGFDKDRFYLQRLAFDGVYKLYEDGRLFAQDASDIYENASSMPADDTPEAHAARSKLQAVLDSMKPYSLFDPATVPRTDPAMELLAECAFLSSLGYVVMEAESVPAPRDESWRVENMVPGFTGKGYIRALRDQSGEPAKGILRFPFQTLIDGEWQIGIRFRNDHSDPAKTPGLWVRLDGGPWRAHRALPQDGHAGWRWSLAGEGGALGRPVQFARGSHTIQIAPMDDNLKVDRIVAWHEARDGAAIRETYPESDFNPWIRVEAKPDPAPPEQ